jgi:hypothetical protein
MARGFLRVYRTYNPLGQKNPVIDKMRTVLQDEGMFAKKRRQILHEISGVAVTTFDGWFEGDTINPRHETIMATMSSVGYEEQFVKKKEIDIEKERELAAKWLEQQERKGAIKKTKTKPNGHSKAARRAK